MYNVQCTHQHSFQISKTTDYTKDMLALCLSCDDMPNVEIEKVKGPLHCGLFIIF